MPPEVIRALPRLKKAAARANQELGKLPEAKAKLIIQAAQNVIQAIKLLADSCNNFTEFLVQGLTPNREQIDAYLHRSLMLVTALTPLIGYDRAAEIAHLAHAEGLTLKEAALKLGYITAEDFDRLVDPYKMAYPEV
jgi:fumarate hydratase class II